MPVNVSWLNDKPQHWSSYLPQEDDFETAQEYLDALQKGSTAYYEDSTPIGEYWDPIGQVTRGGAQTEVEQGLRKLQYKFKNLGGDALNSMGLQSWIQNNPELARAAYGAYTPLGEAVLDPGMLAMIERLLGIEGAPPPATEAPPAAVVSDNPPSITATPYVVYGSNGEQTIYVSPDQKADPGRVVKGTDGNNYIVNPDGTVSVAFYPPDTGPGSPYVPAATDDAVMPPKRQVGVQPSGVNDAAMPPARTPGQGATQESAPLMASAMTPQDVLAQYGIMPPAQVAQDRVSPIPMPQPGNGYSPDMVARFQQRRKQLQTGGRPIVPRIGY